MVLDSTHVKKRSKLWAWLQRNHTFVYIMGGIIVVWLGALAATFFVLAAPDTDRFSFSETPPKPAPKFYSPLDGREVASEKDVTKPVTAVMIENTPMARPQSGIADGEVVFEAIAEAGITRFVVIYQQDSPKKIGPVRSIRPYYIDYMQPFQPSIAHVGGSAAGKREARNGKHRDIDQFFHSGTYWRSSDRSAPHNMYTSMSRLNKLNKKLGFKKSTVKPFSRTDGTPSKSPNATTINVNVSSADYNSRYTYNSKNNTYTRYEGGALHKDTQKGAVTPSVVVVMKQSLTGGYRKHIKTTGSGSGYVFQNGTVQKVTWHKPKKSDQYTFTDSDGKDVKLVRGRTWLTSIPTDKKVTWTGPKQ